MGEKWPRNFAESGDFHITFGAELAYWEIILMTLTDTYVLHFEQRSPFQFEIYQDIIPRLLGKFHPLHPAPKNKRTCEL
jgi:hypothetical protein